MRLIDADELLTAFPVDDELTLTKSCVRMTIKNMPTIEPEQRWIPCSERLPDKKKERYWVCTDTEYQCECRWTNNRFDMGDIDEWGWSIFDTPQYSHVVAWMPLPEPYQGGQ